MTVAVASAAGRPAAWLAVTALIATAMAVAPGAPAAAAAQQPAAATDVPSLERGFVDQLGLRLESRQGPVDVLIIDSARRPDAH